MQIKKQYSFPTCQSNETYNSIANSVTRLKNQFKYDIHDYLPSDIDHNYKVNYFGSFGKRQQIRQITNNYQVQSRMSKDEDSCQVDTMWVTLKDKNIQMNELLKKKQSQMQTLKQQNQVKQKLLQQKLTKQLQQLSNKQRKIYNQNQANLQKIKTLQQNINKIIAQKNQIAQQLSTINKQNQRKNKNIRIFCQKYQIFIQPKYKQKYTIEVQTEKDLLMPLLVLQEQTTVPVPVFPHFPITLETKSESNNKAPSPSRPQFYQMYQQQQNQKQNQHNFDLNQYTSRSQIIGGGSGLKPKKPSFMENASNVVQFNERNKQNDRKRINQRIDGIVGSGLQAEHNKQKIKLKYEQIQIYPIYQSNVQDIVQGILALK